MQDMIITTVLLSALGIGLRLWFTYASMRALSGSRRTARSDEGFGLSFDEKVRRRLAELPQVEREGGDRL